MLFRLVRPVKRSGSKNQQYVRRIPADVRSQAAGLKLSVPVGKECQAVLISPRAQSVRLSLRTDDPKEVKLRLAQVDAYLDNVFASLRDSAPVSLSHREATALAGEMYRGWANGSGRERVTAIEHDPEFNFPDDHIRKPGPDGTMQVTAFRRVKEPQVDAEEWAGVQSYLERLGASGDPADLEEPLGAVVDRLLLAKGILRVTEETRSVLLQAFWLAFKDAIEARTRNAKGDYSPDPKAQRFPSWGPTKIERALPSDGAKVSLKGLVESWWTEAKAIGLKLSTYESYSNTIELFVKFLGHDDAKVVSRDDVVRFKDHRLASINPRKGTPISPKTIKDNDLSGLKTVFGWAKANGKMAGNPAEGVTIKAGKPPKLRSKGFTDEEAQAILRAASNLQPGRERPKMFAAKRWIPWLCAYTGARVGELIQLRKEDITKQGEHWVMKITPEAGTVKTNEARDVVLHGHLVELGFPEFVKTSAEGHLFITLKPGKDVSAPLQSVKNRVAEFVRTVVSDQNVAPNHGWRHRFKTVGMEAGIEHRILDAIQGHSARNIGESYGEVSIKAQAAAMAKFPRYQLER